MEDHFVHVHEMVEIGSNAEIQIGDKLSELLKTGIPQKSRWHLLKPTSQFKQDDRRCKSKGSTMPHLVKNTNGFGSVME
jgi:hypothetical protein